MGKQLKSSSSKSKNDTNRPAGSTHQITKKPKVSKHSSAATTSPFPSSQRNNVSSDKQINDISRSALSQGARIGKNLSVLQSKFAKKLEGGRFRFINEKLYKSTGDEAFDEFQGEPELFDVYHVGYREQVLQWPENPLDKIIKWIRDKHPKAEIADLGCGEARLAESVKNKVHSFDLVSRKPFVTACNIAHTPLRKESVDIVVFCLSLMGTTISDFVKEAHRILKPDGIVKITEVRSRFESEEHGVKKFLKVLKKAGFDIVFQPTSANTMFFEVECKKTDRISDFDTTYSVKPCVYKKR